MNLIDRDELIDYFCENSSGFEEFAYDKAAEVGLIADEGIILDFAYSILEGVKNVIKTADIYN